MPETFPPTCCTQEIDLRQPIAQLILGPETMEEYRSRVIEKKTEEPLYCINADCGIFIRPGLIDLVTHIAHCPGCGLTVCVLCKNSKHENDECPQDPALEQIRELARREGWQRCKCGQLVQRISGCRHMT